jgi:hypothetical protein
MRKIELMGLGVPAELARRQATDPITFTAVGGTQPSAAQLGGDQYFISVISTNSGGGINLPNVGGISGCYLGDDFIINNQTTSSLTIYASTNTAISMSGSNTSGPTGVTVSSHTTTAFYPVTASSWLGLHGG